jgi:hypothetical protein
VSDCQVRVAPSHDPCGQPAIASFAYGCVHEHVTRATPACHPHAEVLRNCAVYCSNCQRHDGHECRLYAIERPVAAASHLYGGNR